MPKKRKQTYVEYDDDLDAEPEWLEDELDALDEPAWTEEDIQEICGATNAAKGLALYESDAVTPQASDDVMLRAVVRDSAGTWNVEFDTIDEESVCPCPQHRRGRYGSCEHVAALLYAFIGNPKAFLPHTMGDVVKLLEKSPELRAQVGANNANWEAALQLIKNAPPEVRAALDKLPLDGTANLEQMPQLVAAQRDTELKALLEGLSVSQLREIADRRGWSRPSTKGDLVAHLAGQLKLWPAPAEFPTEEEQLLRFENTLYGFQDVPTANELNALWKKRAGGDMARLERALRGLQQAGVLFQCAREGGPQHYHWSPFLDSAKLPLLRPKVTPYPPNQAARLEVAAPSLPFLTWVDAALELIQREPIQLLKPVRDEQASRLPYIGMWEYEPQELAKLQTPRYVPQGAAEGLTVPVKSPFVKSSLATLGAFLQAPSTAGEAAAALGTRDFAAWLAAMVVVSSLARANETGRVELVIPSVEEYRLQPAVKQYRGWWDLWLAGGTSELWLTFPARGLTLKRALAGAVFTPQHLSEELGRARQFITRLLSGLDPLIWYDWDSFVKMVRELRPDFLHSDSDERTWWFASDGGRFKLSSHNPQHWESAYRPILTTIFEGPLRWLGAVEVGYQKAKFAAFQITAAGAWLFSEGQVGTAPGQALPEESTESGELVTWLDDETFRVRPTATAAPLLTAARSIAEATRELLTFRISNAAIARAFEQGLEPAILAQKFKDAGAPLPAGARMRLDELYGNYGRTHLYERLTVLELADDYVLRELLASTSLRRHIVHQFSPRLIVIADEAVDEFVNELVKKGYTPRVTS